MFTRPNVIVRSWKKDLLFKHCGRQWYDEYRVEEVEEEVVQQVRGLLEDI